MKKSLTLLVGLFVGVLFTFIGSSMLHKSEAQITTDVIYEYAVIESIYTVAPEKDKVNMIIGGTDVCFFYFNGCRKQSYVHELNYPDFLQDHNLSENYESRKIASRKATQIAFQKTVSSLGNQGWEMISDPKMEFQVIERNLYIKPEVRALSLYKDNTVAIYFKKEKQEGARTNRRNNE